MNNIINVSKTVASIALASVFVVIGTSVVLPTTAQATASSYASSVTYSSPTTYSSYGSNSNCCTSASSYGSSVNYSSPASTPSSYASSVNYSSTPNYTPSSYASSVNYSSTPSYTPSSYASSVNYSYPVSTPVYTSSSNYSTPTYTSSSNYSTPTYTSSSNYATPTYTSSSNYAAPSYSYAPSHSSNNYTITSTSGGGSTNTVLYQPVCQIYANPSSVAYNGGATVTWSSNYATSASLSEVGSVATNGSYTFNNLTAGHTYVLTVTGTGGTNTCSTTVYVQPQVQTPVCTITANPTSVQSGGNATVTWTSTNATSASLSDTGSVATNGSYTFNNLTTTKTYILTVTGQGGTNTCSTSVGVYDNQQQAPYCTLTINPSTINNNNYNNGYNYNNNNNNNNSAVMSWTATNATSATIDTIGTVNAYSGSQTIYPGYSRTYTMHVYGANGQSNTCSGYVNVQTTQQNNLWCTISVQPQYVTNNGSAIIMWTSGGATSAFLSDGLGTVSTNGNRTVYPNGAHTYTLTVNDGSGNTQTCQTNVNGTTVYTPPTTPTYVSLTQIPYTGFDFGLVGNSIYWAVLASGAAAAAYLMTMYRGGAMNYGLAFLGARSNHIVASEEGEDEDEEPAEESTETTDNEEEPRSTGDAMTLEMVNGMPRLSINRVKRTGAEGLPGQI